MKLDWKHLFNWDVVAVKAPEKVINDGKLTGYQVVVTYKYHGTDKEFYSIDDERLYTTYRSPEDAAQEAFRGHLAKMGKQMKAQMRTR